MKSAEVARPSTRYRGLPPVLDEDHQATDGDDHYDRTQTPATDTAADLHYRPFKGFFKPYALGATTNITLRTISMLAPSGGTGWSSRRLSW